MKQLLVTIGLIVAIGGCGGDDQTRQPGSAQPPSDEQVVESYCEYGAVSSAQLNGCIDHVTIDDVTDRDTNAARYAMGELAECLGDAGPFCDER